MKILICFGTRPEWLKVKPLLKVLDNYKLLFTGQHEDLLEEIQTDYQIEISNYGGRLDSIIGSCLTRFPYCEDIDAILVQGDTASAFGCALAAFHRKIKIYYLEAGLRSYNLEHPYPEEGYRQMISRISDVNFCPTSFSKNNLLHELVKGDCHVVGNTCLDNLLSYKEKCQYGKKVLVTLHRRENYDLIDDWFDAINTIAKDNSDLEFILPMHPSLSADKYNKIKSNVNVIDALPHKMFLDILCDCKLVISDSGGIQEEASFLNKKVIVCRKTTERPEGRASGHLVMCPTPDELAGIFRDLNDNYEIDLDCPYGDGKSSEKIAKIINAN